MPMLGPETGHTAYAATATAQIFLYRFSKHGQQALLAGCLCGGKTVGIATMAALPVGDVT